MPLAGRASGIRGSSRSETCLRVAFSRPRSFASLFLAPAPRRDMLPKTLRMLRRGPVLLNIFHYLLFVEFLFCIIFQINACALSRKVLRLGFGGKVGEAAGRVVVEPLLLVALAVRARDPSTPSLNRYGLRD